MNDLAPIGEQLAGLVTESPRAHWAGQITEAYCETIGAAIKTGRLIAEAKAALKHGEFMDMVEQDLPFSLTTAERLMKLAAHPVISDSANWPNLPDRPRILYELTKVAFEDLQSGLADGSVNPDMTHADAARLAGKVTDAEAGAGDAKGPQAVDEKVGQGDMFGGDGEDAEPNKPRDHRATMAGRVETDDLDFYPTGPWITRALMERVMPHLGVSEFGSVWEPACGEGHMVEVLREYFDDLTISDVQDYGYRMESADFEQLDFLNPDEAYADVDWIITNPPYGDRLDPFISRALRLARVGVAVFAQVRIAEGLNRYETIYRLRPPTVCAFFVERAACVKGRWDAENNSTATAYWWLVWLKGRNPLPPFWIPPGCRESLTKDDDVERFTQHPVKALPASAFVKATEPAPAQAWTSPLADDDLVIPKFLVRHAVTTTIEWPSGDNPDATLGINVGTCSCGATFRVPRGATPEENVAARTRLEELIAEHHRDPYPDVGAA